jgi:hypothetical protein
LEQMLNARMGLQPHPKCPVLSLKSIQNTIQIP